MHFKIFSNLTVVGKQIIGAGDMKLQFEQT